MCIVLSVGWSGQGSLVISCPNCPFISDSWLPARSIVESTISKRFDVHPSGKIAVLEVGGCPWKDHLFTIEEETGIGGEILYVLYEDLSGQWRIQCVPEVTWWTMRMRYCRSIGQS